MKSRFISFALWFVVISFGVQFGGAAYEQLVITPLWAGSPPTSVRSWNSDPAFAIQPGAFWAKAVGAATLATIAVLAAAAMTRGALRVRCLTAGICGLAVLISTAVFFVPILRETIFTRGAALTDSEIVRKVHLWTGWNWARAAVLACGWIAAIAAIGRRGANVGMEGRR